MPWKFSNPHDVAEAAQRQQMLGKIDRWWDAFRARAADLDALFRGWKKWDLPAWMNEHLQGISPELMWEFGGNERGGHYLVITPEANKELRPLVETILERAPRLGAWDFHGYRPPCPAEVVGDLVQAKTGGDLSDTTVSVARGEHNAIELTYLSPRYTKKNQEAGWRDSLVATECLVGEEVLDKWIGAISVRKNKGKPGLPLGRLRETVEALIGSVQDQLPDRPVFEWPDEPRYAMFELEPEEAEEHAGRADLWIAPSMLPEMWQYAHSGRSFYSVRFSRCGEVFCYVKTDGEGAPANERLAARREVEQAVNGALREAKVGCVLGGGTGLRYSYIDLALTDVVRGADVVRTALRARKCARRTWLQFFDCEWGQEWIGIGEEAPAPPM